MKKIVSIPTVYNNVRFRSRFEADWARWLDDQGIVWSYETEGFKVGGVWYLPDFYLPEINTIIEVKGVLQGLEKPFALFKAIYELNYNKAVKEWSQLDVEEWEGGARFEHEFAEGQVFWFPKYLFLLGGSPVPSLYNIHDTVDYRLSHCSECNHSWICTIEGSYACRICGAYNGNHDVRIRWDPSYSLLRRPLEWVELEEKDND